MPGIDLKKMWTTLRSMPEAIWKFFEAWLNDPFAVMQRGLVSSGILSPASTQGALGLVWTVFVWFAALPLLVLAYLTALALALPGIIALSIGRLVKWPFTPRQPRSNPAQPIGTTGSTAWTTVPPGTPWWQYLWRVPLAIVMIPLLVFLEELAQSLFLWIILLGFGMWVLLMLGILFVSGSLFGFGVMIGRDNSPAASNSFTTVCNYRNLTQRDMISMTFDTSAARTAFSCPAFKRMGGNKK